MNGLKQFKKVMKGYLELMPSRNGEILNECAVCGRKVPVYNRLFCCELCKEIIIVMIFKKLTEFEDWRSSDGNKRIKL